LIDQTARYALEHGYHVILEGILNSAAYGAMLRQLIADHAGPTGVYYFQLPFDETLRRHSTRPLAKVITLDQMRQWYQACDLLGVPAEQVIDTSSSLDESVERIIGDLAWTTGGAIAHALED
jgi:hypothetical protein